MKGPDLSSYAATALSRRARGRSQPGNSSKQRAERWGCSISTSVSTSEGCRSICRCKTAVKVCILRDSVKSALFCESHHKLALHGTSWLLSSRVSTQYLTSLNPSTNRLGGEEKPCQVRIEMDLRWNYRCTSDGWCVAAAHGLEGSPSQLAPTGAALHQV